MTTKTARATPHEKMVEQFQCPGCVAGSDIGCGRFKLSNDYGASCSGQVPGTRLMPGGLIALGLPRGFNKIGDHYGHENEGVYIRLWLEGDAPTWDHLNIPVWAIVEEGHLFVRTYSPRTNRGYVDVIKGGTLEMVPKALDVGKFKDEID